jgi:hypothetical protein
MPRFYGKLYPGRLNRQELFKHRAVEQYEAVMTDLYLMGIITKEQFEAYNHRWILPQIRPKLRDYLTLPEKADNYFVRDFYDYQHTAIGFSVDKDNNPPPDDGTANQDLWFMLSYNDGKPPQKEPPDPIGWYLCAWEWDATDKVWKRAYYPQSVEAKERHYVQLEDGTYHYIHFDETSGVPDFIEFEQNDYMLPFDWIDVPALTDTADLTQVNLVTGQHRSKPSLDNTKTQHIKKIVSVVIPQNVFIYNTQVPIATPAILDVISPYILLLQKYPNQPNVLYQLKAIETYPTDANFPATGDPMKLYLAEDEPDQYYYWTGSAYAVIADQTRINAFYKPDTSWLSVNVDSTLPSGTVVIINFDGSFITNGDEVVPIPYAHGIQFKQDANGLIVRTNLPIFYDACTDVTYVDGTQVELVLTLNVRYDE